MLFTRVKKTNCGKLDNNNNNNDKNVLLRTPVCTRKKMIKVEIKATYKNMLSEFCLNMFLKEPTGKGQISTTATVNTVVVWLVLPKKSGVEKAVDVF